MRKASESKNVFCLEGAWDKNLKYKSTIEPVLNLLEKNGTIKYIHKDCATITELEYYLTRWTLKTYSDFPVLYLAFHGSENNIHLLGGEVSLDRLSEILAGKCKGRMIIFGSCNTLKIDKRHIKRFLKETQALAVLGYQTEIDWIKSTVHDLLLLEAIQENEFSGRGINSINAKTVEISSKFKELEFLIVTQAEK
jgi:hypothetical protein